MADEAVPLHLEPLLKALRRHEVEYVVTGSVGAVAYGLDLRPGDLDIAPELSEENLGRLAGLLTELGAKPKFVPSWRRGLTRDACERWRADPHDEANLDHRFVTPRGDLDVVPRLAGTYADLATRALPMNAYGIRILVAHVEDLIVLCRKWDRETDRARMGGLIAVRARLAEGWVPPGIGMRPDGPSEG